MEEIKESVVQVLDKQGVLATLKAQLRACVFAVVDGEEGKSYGTDLEQRAKNPQKAKLTSTSEGMLLLKLVREFLAWTNMTYALKVYEAEANMGTEAAARDQLCQQLGLQHTTEEPLLLSLLHRYMAHGDPMLSPRIAAKAKSSIAAKPGGHTVNISAPAPQAPLRQAADVIKAAHYPTPPLVPAAAAAAAAMHPGAQQQRSSQLQNIAGAQLGSTSPHSISPVASRSASPLGPAAPGETPQVSPRQLVLAAGGAAAAHTTPAAQGAASARGSGAHDAVSTSHTEVPMIRQIAPETSDASLQPSTSGTSIISEDIEFEIEDSRGSGSSLLASTALTAAAVRAHTDQHTCPTAASSGRDTEQQMQSAGLQSPGSSVSPSNPVLSLSVPTEANRKIFTEQKAESTPIKVAIPTEVNRKAFPESPGGLISPGDNSTVYEPDSLSASAKSSPSRHGTGDESTHPSPATSPAPKLSPSGVPASAPSGPSSLAPSALTPKRLATRLPPLAPLQASPSHRSAEQIRKELREQDNWFDETDESADESVGSPVPAAQTWKVHQGLGSGDAHSQGTMNAAFVDYDSIPDHGMPQYSFDHSVPDEF
ncbi:TPA: FGFR1 oncoprotein partner [Trebouxia sp. C0005]